jgi:hypothetical protein
MSWQLDKEDLGSGMSDFLVEFIRYVGVDCKAWSHHGMLPSLLPSDPRVALMRGSLDVRPH